VFRPAVAAFTSDDAVLTFPLRASLRCPTWRTDLPSFPTNQGLL